MNWFKQNPFYAALLIITILACGGAGFFLFKAKGEYDAVSADYDTEARSLLRLQAQDPFPSAENQEKLKLELSDYTANAMALRDQLVSRNLEVPVLTPGEFQQTLLEAVNELKNKAANGRVTLPAEFFLGFLEFRDTLPENEVTPQLTVQLKAIDQIVQLLVDTNVASVTGIQRDPVEAELPPAPAVEKESKRSRKKSKDQEEEEAPAVVLTDRSEMIRPYGFEIGFTCEHAAFESILNEITQMEAFYVIRAVSVRNERPQAPAKGMALLPSDPNAGGNFDPNNPESLLNQPDAGQPAEGEAPVIGGGEAGDIEALKFVLGREKVDVVLRIELFEFKAPEQGELGDSESPDEEEAS